ncbi:peptidase domain-containing ABC transporter [Hymenobacter latericus]|uniref:peptidase domain-containing ABC transporter n=1 Tax=Hymenobacter sp. YIM 151858-1 TaxID=2987688 RepID=UPI002227876A|nr:peptidase domain-containing ABC transporter [Hymenobacter sp. YIM 151858-1]UYZ58727.1 peptidase domain-containing ABC transporter [Hymenobacter sp. YIM 151858-1]
MRKAVKIRQRDITDCGAACLASVAAHYKLLLPVARIRQYATTDQRGTNLVGMIKAANHLGFQAKGVKGTLESLSKIPLPAVAHVVLANQLHHYVVVYRVTKKHVQYMDPADGQLHRVALAQFKEQWTGVLLLLAPDTSFQPGDHKVSVLGRFWQLIRPHRSVMTQALFGAAMYTVLGLAMSVYVQKIVDHVLVDGNRNLLNLLSVGMLLLLLFQTFIGGMKSLLALQTGQQIDARLILGYYNHLLKLPQTFFDTMRVGEIISRVNDAVKIRAFVNDTALGLLVNLFTVVFSFGLMFTYDWKLAVLMLGILPLYGAIYWLQNRLNRRYQRRLMEQSAELESQLVESITAMGTIKRFGMESFAGERTENRFIALLRTVYFSGKHGIAGGAAAEFVSQLFRIGLLWVGSYYVLDHELTPGELLSFYAVIGYFTGPATSLIGANRTVQDALIAADRLFEIIDLERESHENKAELTPELTGDIQLRDVAFAYNTRGTVFRSLSLHIPKGAITGIVGESGSGKTTLLSLLQGLYPLNGGSITIGGLDIRHLQPESLRRVVSVVPQQIDLFSGSIVENIAVGDTEPDLHRIIAICRQLGILEFIEKLPYGFGTMLGERGAGLSGGQKQRLAIARALYRNPEILILDEATSALDTISEQYVQRTLQQFRDAGKTVLLIAHRLSTVMHADKIVVLGAGELLEEGTHDELLSAGGAYYALWQQLMPLPVQSVPASAR